MSNRSKQALLVLLAALRGSLTSFGQEPLLGSLFREDGSLTNPASDLRAARKGDLVTIQVADRAVALASATTTTSRTSSAEASIPALLGPVPTTRLSDLARLGGRRSLDGAGDVRRESSFSTTITAVVEEVYPNGALRVRAAKAIRTSGETHTIAVAGVVRQVDINTGNVVSSDRVALLEVSIDGKGVIQDAVKRPSFLYRLLVGLLPF